MNKIVERPNVLFCSWFYHSGYITQNTGYFACRVPLEMLTAPDVSMIYRQRQQHYQNGEKLIKHKHGKTVR